MPYGVNLEKAKNEISEKSPYRGLVTWKNYRHLFWVSESDFQNLKIDFLNKNFENYESWIFWYMFEEFISFFWASLDNYYWYPTNDAVKILDLPQVEYITNFIPISYDFPNVYIIKSENFEDMKNSIYNIDLDENQILEVEGWINIVTKKNWDLILYYY